MIQLGSQVSFARRHTYRIRETHHKTGKAEVNKCVRFSFAQEFTFQPSFC